MGPMQSGHTGLVARTVSAMVHTPLQFIEHTRAKLIFHRPLQQQDLRLDGPSVSLGGAGGNDRPWA